MIKIKGIIPAAITTYDDQGGVSPQRLKALYEFLIKSGVNGLFVGGSNGEWPLQTIEERELAVQVALDTACGKVPVLMHISSMLPKEVVAYAKWAQKAGVAAVSVVMPYYYTCDDEGLLAYFDQILPYVELPIFLYNIPGNVKNPLRPSLLKTLMERYQVVCGVKDSSMDFLRFQEFALCGQGRDFTLLTGNDGQVLPCLMWGGSGAISAAACAFPELACRMYQSFEQGQLDSAKEMQNRLMEYRSFVVANSPMSVVKAALELRGIETGGLRAPLHTLSQDKKEQLAALMQRLELA